MAYDGEELGSAGGGLTDEFASQRLATKSNPYNEGRPPLRITSESSPSLSASSYASEVPTLPSNGIVKSADPSPRLRTARRSASNDSYRTNTSPTTHVQRLRHRPSEGPGLRASRRNSKNIIANGPSVPEIPTVENFSKPRSRNNSESQVMQRPKLIQSSTFPLQAGDDNSGQRGLPATTRERGRSTSSSRSTATFPSISLRPSTSTPDYGATESAYSRQRNLSNNSGYRPVRGFSDTNYVGSRKEPNIRTNGLESDEVRASIRSALTTNSSHFGTSGTERSSVLTKSSAATSVYGPDEGMSVDEAIEMYENGFADSDAEDEDAYRTRTSRINQNPKIKPSDIGSLGPPSPANFIIRDSTAMFEEPEEASDGSDGGRLHKTEGFMENVERDSREGRAYTNGHALSRSTTHSSPPSFDETRDRYGFYKKSQHISHAQYESWNSSYTQYLARRRKKWVALLKEAGLPTDRPSCFPPKSSKVKRFIRKGIPPDWRGAAWFYFAGGPAMIGKYPSLYAELVRKSANGELSPTDEDDIERDLNRTFPDNIRFKPDSKARQNLVNGNRNSTHTINESETPILQSLRRVLRAFAIYNPRVGYCQSLNFLAGLLLLFMNEENSFWLLNIIAREYLPGTHARTLEGANVDLGVLMTSVRETMPSTWTKIGGELDGTAGSSSSNRLPPVTLCCTAWFMSCFIGTFPIETTLRVWDSFFYEGSKTFFRIALTIFKVGEQEIKAVSDPMEIFQVVQTIPRRLIDANALMEACFKRRNGFGHLSQETIEARRAERRGYTEERDRGRVVGGENGGEATIRRAEVSRKGTLFSRRRGKII